MMEHCGQPADGHNRRRSAPSIQNDAGMKTSTNICKRHLPNHLFPLMFSFVIAALTGCATVNRGGNFTEKVMESTYPIASENAMGTGFIVALKDPKVPQHYTPVVITTGHFLKTTSKKGAAIPLRLYDKNGQLWLFLIANRPPPHCQHWYVRHPDLDIAAFELTAPPSLPRDSFLQILEKHDLSTKEAPPVGAEVCFAGFPDGIPSSDGMFPILRSGKVASVDQEIFDTRQFLINGDVFPGDSGSPVFSTAKSRNNKVVGMIIQLLGPDKGHPLPVAVAVDAQSIHETLKKFERR